MLPSIYNYYLLIFCVIATKKICQTHKIKYEIRNVAGMVYFAGMVAGMFYFSPGMENKRDHGNDIR